MTGEFLLLSAGTPASGGTAPYVVPLMADGRIFRERDTGLPWRYKGISGFKLPELFRVGGPAACDPFLDAYPGFNLVRAWSYVEWGPDESWDVKDAATINAFIEYCNGRGWYVEFTLLTDDAPERLAWAQALVPKLRRADGSLHPGLLLEGGNEPLTHKEIDTSALRDVLAASGYLYASGDYEDSKRAYGTYGVTHTARTYDWPRRAHDLMEFYGGGGPNEKTDPAHPYPWVGDEPGKLQDVGTIPGEWRAYFGTCAVLGAGATFHSETGKYAELPTDAERACAAAALEGLDAFPADAPNGPYARIVEDGQPDEGRTYIVGDCMTRCQQNGTAAPEPGWTSLDPDGILWTR